MKKETFVLCLLSFVLLPALAVEIPKDVAACANFEKAPRAVKEAFKKAAGDAVAAGDTKTLGALLDLLAKEPVGTETFNLWAKAAEQVNAAALIARDRRKAAASQELIAGFREGGTTFGLNTGALEKESANDPGAPFVETARAILTSRMPQKDLSLRFRLQRDVALLAMQQKAGRRPGQLAANDVVEKAAFAAAPTDRDGTNAVVKALDASLAFRLSVKDWAGYRALWDRVEKDRPFYPNVKAMRLASLANAACQANDEKLFDAFADELDRLPLDSGLLAAVNFAAGQVSRKEGSREMVARLWRRLVDGRAAFAPQERMRILVAMASMADRSNVRRLPKGSIEPLRKVWDEARALEAETAAADKRAHRGVSAAQVRATWLRNLQAFHLWAEAYELVKGDALAPRANAGQRAECVRLAALGGDEAAFKAAYDAVITNAQLTAAQKFNLNVLAAVKAAKGDQADFAKRVAALRGDADNKTYFNLLRGACKYLYGFDSSVEGSKHVMTLVGLSAAELWPEERVEYVATYLEDAPMTANAAYLADVFRTLKTDNRMGKFNCWDSMDKNKDLARLKSGEKPNLAAAVEGKEAAVCACYDTKGLHFYLKFNDPEAWKTRDGLADGLYMECSVQTGDEANWHWELISALHPENKVDVEWDSPEFGRKMTRDYLKSDVFVAKDCYVVHVFAPWLLAYDRIPSGKDALWRFVAVAGWAGQFGSIGGGSVHELGRGMQVRFDMPAKAERAVRLGVLRAAAGEYRRFRKAWENADFWGDPSIGDPAFYEADVKPYLAELDAAANETEGELDDAALARLSARLVDFSDTRLVLDAKRAAYLRAKRFKE